MKKRILISKSVVAVTMVLGMLSLTRPSLVAQPADGAQIPPKAAKVVRVSAVQALAKVNDANIGLKDLLPVGAAVAEQAMSPETYDFLLQRAIERELTFQAARAQAIELTTEQIQRREQIRQRLLARRAADAAAQVLHLNAVGTPDDQIEFELREITAQFLLNSLLAKAGVPGPDVTEERVKQQYESHRNEYAGTPADPAKKDSGWQKIDSDIRQKLATQVRVEHQQKVQEFFDQLKASAKITKNPPPV
jgi:hypothetical protein